MATKERLNICFIGHVDSGKSTTVGNLAYRLGCVDKRKMEKLEKEANEMGKGSFWLAHVTDTNKAERDRGITITTTLIKIETSRYSLNVIDCPGHKDFIKNMVTGTAQADCGVVLVPAGAGEFEGALAGGVMKEHILISGILGVPKLIFAINKIDLVPEEDQERRIREIITELRTLTKGSHPDQNPIFIVISAYNNINLVKGSERLKTYAGWKGKDENGNDVIVNTLEEALDYQRVPPRPVEKPLRVPLNDSLKISGIGTVLTGQVVSGKLTQGMQVVIQPGDIKGEIKSLEIHKTSVPEVPAGENCGFVLKVTSGDAAHIKTGYVLSEAKKDTVQPCSGARARIIIVDHPKGIKRGYTPVMDLGTSHVPVKIAKFLSKRPKGSKEEVSEPDIAMRGDTLFAVIVPQKPCVMESAKKTPQLGRLALRDGGKVVGLGAVDIIYNDAELIELGCKADPKAPAPVKKDTKKKK